MKLNESLITTKQFLEQYYGDTPKHFFIVSLSLESKKVKQKKLRKPSGFDIESKLQYFVDRNTHFSENVYFTLGKYKAINQHLKRTKEYLSDILSVYFDIDENSTVITQKIIQELGTPTFIVNTSPDKKQLIYKLKQSLSSDMREEFESVQKKMIQYFQTDTTYDATRMFRLAGFINHKNGYRVNYTFNDVQYDFEVFKKFVSAIEQ